MYVHTYIHVYEAFKAPKTTLHAFLKHCPDNSRVNVRKTEPIFIPSECVNPQQFSKFCKKLFSASKQQQPLNATALATYFQPNYVHMYIRILISKCINESTFHLCSHTIVLASNFINISVYCLLFRSSTYRLFCIYG